MRNTIYVWVGIAFCSIGFMGCKRMTDTQGVADAEGAAKSSKEISVKIPEDSLPAPIAPDQARVQLTVLRLLPDLEPAGSGPCSQQPCKATVRIDKVVGYGSSFQGALGEKQVMQMSFPMTFEKHKGLPGVKAGGVLLADIQGPLLGGSDFTVVQYSSVQP